MRKALKIILAVILVLVVIFAVFAALFFLDIAAYTGPGAKTLTPTGASVGKALVVYDPGLSANSKNVADKVASDLQTQNYTVTLAGIKTADASKTAGYTIIVAGGPIYAGSPTSSVKDFLNNLKPDTDAKVGVFGSGQGATTPSDVAAIKDAVTALKSGNLQNAVIVKIGEKEDLTTRAQDFVTQLTQ
jgi:flavodoxin